VCVRIYVPGFYHVGYLVYTCTGRVTRSGALEAAVAAEVVLPRREKFEVPGRVTRGGDGTLRTDAYASFD
jgi:hypothetical protein